MQKDGLLVVLMCEMHQSIDSYFIALLLVKQFIRHFILFLLRDGCGSIDVLNHGVLLSSGGLETSNLTASKSSDLLTHEPLVDELVLLISGGEANG